MNYKHYILLGFIVSVIFTGFFLFFYGKKETKENDPYQIVLNLEKTRLETIKKRNIKEEEIKKLQSERDFLNTEIKKIKSEQDKIKCDLGFTEACFFTQGVAEPKSSPVQTTDTGSNQ